MVNKDTGIILRLESALVFSVCCYAFAQYNGNWLLFLYFFFIPDLALVAYWAGPRFGAIFYNIMHSYMLPLALLIMSFSEKPQWFSLAIIWLAHISFDRMLGYGLKYQQSIHFTHLGEKRP